MKTNKTTYKISKLAFPFLGLAFLIAATTLFCPDTFAAGEEKLNVPPEGFKALFNGKDFTGWDMTKLAKAAWFIEGGMLRSLGGFDDFKHNIVTEEKFLNFVFMTDYRMLTKSDSGIYFRGGSEQVNLHNTWAVGQPMLFHGYEPAFSRIDPKDNKMIEDQKKAKLKEVKSEPGVWHTIKFTLVGRVLTVEHDGEVILDAFEYPEGTLDMEPGSIQLQKHKNWDYDGDGNVSNCPIEFRNVFIKELDPVK